VLIRIGGTEICKEAGPKIDAEETQQAHMFMSPHQNADQNNSVRVNKPLENLSKFICNSYNKRDAPVICRLPAANV
jgi:hypothetical protein